MPCPFPGMDPFLEMPPFWGDFAPTLLAEIRNALLPRLLPRYDVRIEECLVVTQEDVRLHRVLPDVTISTTEHWRPEAKGAVAVAEPTTVELDYPEIEPHTQRHLRLIHRPTGFTTRFATRLWAGAWRPRLLPCGSRIRLRQLGADLLAPRGESSLQRPSFFRLFLRQVFALREIVSQVEQFRSSVLEVLQQFPVAIKSWLCLAHEWPEGWSSRSRPALRGTASTCAPSGPPARR